MNQVEFLLRLSENAQDKGDELLRERDKVYSVHAKELLELSRMIEAAKANIDNELGRFSRWVPREEAAPRLVSPAQSVVPPQTRAQAAAPTRAKACRAACWRGCARAAAPIRASASWRCPRPCRCGLRRAARAAAAVPWPAVPHCSRRFT